MAKIHTSVAQLIGETPMVELSNIEKKDGLRARLLVKPEGFNPGGSAKDRVAPVSYTHLTLPTKA